MYPKTTGFTLIELVIAILLVAAVSAVALPRIADLGTAADRATVEYQAAILVSRDTNNVNACRIESEQCTDFVSTGNQACVNAMAIFAPQLDLDEWVHLTSRAIRPGSSGVRVWKPVRLCSGSYGSKATESPSILMTIGLIRGTPTSPAFFLDRVGVLCFP